MPTVLQRSSFWHSRTSRHTITWASHTYFYTVGTAISNGLYRRIRVIFVTLQEYILHALSQPRPHAALEAEVAEQRASQAPPGTGRHAIDMKRARSVSRAMCASRLVQTLLCTAYTSKHVFDHDCRKTY